MSNYKRLGSQSSSWKKLWLFVLTCSISLLALLALAFAIAVASGSQEHDARHAEENAWKTNLLPGVRHSNSAILAPQTAATLIVNIVSSPWATLDNTHMDAGPTVFVVEAVITNTGTSTATDLNINLDYDVPGTAWMLLPGEDPVRTVDELPGGAAHHAYWFASYPTVYDASHQYTVTVGASNAITVSTSDNFYGNPEPGKTVKTRSTLSTGNSGVTRVAANVVVGVAFTVTVEYDLGKNPQEAIFSPVGNPDFDPTAYRLLASQVHFYDNTGTIVAGAADRLYFNTLPGSAESAEVTYTFIALTPSNTRLCSYAAVGFGNPKYDQFFCQEDKHTIVPITGTVSLSMTKQASSPTIQQNQPLTYTIAYTNNGNVPLVYAWIWDDVDINIVSIIASSINPSSDPDETTDSRVAWDLGGIQPDDAKVLTFTVLVDGSGVDLADGTSLFNPAFFGINQGSLPSSAALTGTVTTAIQAPTILLSKTDGRSTAEPGEALAYTLRITNTGSITATGVVVTDVLPAEVSYTPGSATTPETNLDGRTLTWSELDPIAPNGGTLLITVPVTVGSKVPNETVLTNTMTVKYENPAGWVFDTQTATDATTVSAPILTISKSDFPDPVLTNHLITYTLHYTNSGPTAATDVLITDVVPLDTTYQTCDPTPCGVSNSVVSWTIGTIPSDTDATVSFSVQVSETLATGTLIHNEDYGIIADQTDFISGPPVTTEVSREAAFVDGYAFEDADCDGTYDVGSEGILPGVVITLTEATVPVTTTNPSGYYHFRVETQGPISVTAGLPDGYFRTTPGMIVFLSTEYGITRTVNFGYAPIITSTCGVIFGTVFEDKNHNGVQNVGEDGIEGVTVGSAQAVTPSVTTNDLGQYTLRFDVNAAVTISETNPPFHVSTTPDVVQVNAETSSSGPSPIDFGDFAGVKITGLVFDDRNVNGVNDDGAFVAGATVAADGDSLTTGSSGVYTLYVTVKDSNPILVSETDPVGYLSTNAIPGENMTRVDANTLQLINPVSGTIYSGGAFGDMLASAGITITGQVWDDNGDGGGGAANGLRDGTEPGLRDAIISLSSGLTQTTGSDGSFLLYAPPGQLITVSETDPTGYVSTNAIPGNAASKLDNNTLLVGRLDGGSASEGNLFGDVLADSVAVISGTVFDDADEDGILDGSELGLAGVEVTLEISGGNTIVVTTGSAGDYEFAVTAGTDVRITSAGPGGSFYPTTPESVMMRPSTGGVFPDNDFGYSDDADQAVIEGTVFNDLSGEGVQDLGEPGISNVLISLSDGQTATTNNNGGYTFAVAETGFFDVTETDPVGYHSTTPNTVRVNVAALGQTYLVDFGDSDSRLDASFFGTVFEDQNANAAWDPTEPALSGVTVNLSGFPSPFVTNEWGQFTFLIRIPGTYIATETDPAGYVSTNAIPGSPAVTKVNNNTLRASVSLGTDLGNNLFADVMASQVITINGYVWDDNGAGGGLPGNGEWDGTEPGLAGATVNLSSGMAQTSGSDGSFLLYAPPSEVITVTETNPPGYLSTGAIAGNDATKLDNDTLVIADTLAAGEASIGNLFGDKLCTCLADTYEEDDSPDQARELQVGQLNKQSHDFCDDAIDWVKFEAQANSIYTITTSSWGQRADTFVALFDTNAQTLLAANDDHAGTTDFSSRIVWQARADGVYYVRITNRAQVFGCDTDYDLWIERKPMYHLYMPIVLRNFGSTVVTALDAILNPAGIINHSCPDIYETDDTWQQAHGIEAGVVQVHSFDSDPRIFAADKDFVWFKARAGRTVTFTVAPLINTRTLLELYDEQGAALGNTGTTKLVWTPTTSGRYFLSVSPQTHTFGCSNTVGYGLLFEPVIHELYLPLIGKNS